MIQSVHLLLLLLAAGLHVEPCSCQVVLGEYPSPTSVATYRPVTASSVCGANGAENYCRYTTDAAASLAPQCISTVCNNTCPFSSSSPPPIQIATLGTFSAGVTTTNGRPGTATGALRFVNSSINVSETLLPIVDGRGFSFAAWINQDEGNTGYDNLVHVILWPPTIHRSMSLCWVQRWGGMDWSQWPGLLLSTRHHMQCKVWSMRTLGCILIVILLILIA